MHESRDRKTDKTENVEIRLESWNISGWEWILRTFHTGRNVEILTNTNDSGLFAQAKETSPDTGAKFKTFITSGLYIDRQRFSKIWTPNENYIRLKTNTRELWLRVMDILYLQGSKSRTSRLLIGFFLKKNIFQDKDSRTLAEISNST